MYKACKGVSSTNSALISCVNCWAIFSDCYGNTVEPNLKFSAHCCKSLLSLMLYCKHIEPVLFIDLCLYLNLNACFVLMLTLF